MPIYLRLTLIDDVCTIAICEVIFASVGEMLVPSFITATTVSTTTTTTMTSTASAIIGGGVRVVLVLVCLWMGLLNVHPQWYHMLNHSLQNFSHARVLRCVSNLLLGSNRGLGISRLFFWRVLFEELMVFYFVMETVRDLGDDCVCRLESNLVDWRICLTDILVGFSE